jgi:hypothetical protein
MKKKAQYQYYTADDHLMKRGETMWRVCNSTGDVFKEPELVVFHALTGYNHENISENPYDENHIHFRSVRKAVKWIEEHEKKPKPDFEILSFKKVDQIYTKGTKNWYTWRGATVNINDALEDDSWHIHSVRRLSDGELFTVGDAIHIPASVNKRIHRITKFQLGTNGEIAVDTDNVSGYKFSVINSVSYKKQKLFTTEDGIDIYEKDNYYYYNTDDPDTNDPYSDWAEDRENRRIWTKFKTFSSKKVAQQYILMNKPCLSIQDILKCSAIEEYDLEDLKFWVQTKKLKLK